ncbi:hypothetical protein GYMLUDRAFT_235993 [Collybiopsis luxurians FD-317 M1]|nr:hypothetical protein GYMLUDRAFT_235993 [Collybiopsis luxurians FD-317 M1]
MLMPIDLFLLATSLILGLFTINAYALPSIPDRRMLGVPTGKTLLLHNFDRPWISKQYDDPANLNADDRKVFTKDLTGHVTLQDEIFGSKGDYNAGVYLLAHDYLGHKGDQVVAKILPRKDDTAYAEVKALKTVEYYIDSGLITVHPKAGNPLVASSKMPVVLMKRMVGETLDETEEWKKAKAEKSDKQCVEWMSQTMEMTCKQIVHWAIDKHLLHADFHKRNENIVMKNGAVDSVNIFDMGFPRVFTVHPSAKEAAVQSWCEIYFKSLWPNFGKGC